MLEVLGLRLLLGRALSNAKTDVVAAGKWLSTLSGPQLLCLALAVLLLVDHIGLVIAHRHGAKLEAQLAKSAQQLQTLQANNATLEGAIAKQNKAVAALGAQTAVQQAASAAAVKKAAGRAAKADATAAALATSSRSSAAQAKPCAPSKALTEAWK